LGFVRRGAAIPRTRNALLQSFGHTPLLIRSLELRDPNAGFSFAIQQGAAPGVGARYQLDPGDAMVVQVGFQAQRLGRAETDLLADTNFGPLSLHLIAEGVEA
jgi:hypothetical protein